jgi:hypothetical protein
MGLPIQNLRSGTANKRPLATSLASGQIAVNYNETDPGIYLRGDGNALIKVSPTYIGPTAPNLTPAAGGATGNGKGETWLDNSTTPAVLKVWSGSSWIACFGYGSIDLPGNFAQTVQAVSASNIDCSTGNYFTKTINGNTTFTFSNAPASRAYSFILELTHTSGTITWPAAVKWENDTAPTLNTGVTHLFMFITDDGGTRWRAAALVNYAN